MSERASRFHLWPWLNQPLQEALVQLHSHAVLLHGPEGVGQFDFAMGLARAWLCEQPREAATLGGGFRPACGQCVSCRLLESGSHPDLMLVLPEALQASLGWAGADGESEAEEKGGKARKPSQEIKVDAIRAVVQFAQHTASRGRAKVVVIHPVERMNLIAANTLPKTPGEPPGQVRLWTRGAALGQRRAGHRVGGCCRGPGEGRSPRSRRVGQRRSCSECRCPGGSDTCRQRRAPQGLTHRAADRAGARYRVAPGHRDGPRDRVAGQDEVGGVPGGQSGYRADGRGRIPLRLHDALHAARDVFHHAVHAWR